MEDRQRFCLLTAAVENMPELNGDLHEYPYVGILSYRIHATFYFQVLKHHFIRFLRPDRDKFYTVFLQHLMIQPITRVLLTRQTPVNVQEFQI